jgi:hypothetical protein
MEGAERSIPEKFPASAPMSVGVRDARVCPSKSSLMPAMAKPFPSTTVVRLGLMWRSGLALVGSR